MAISDFLNRTVVVKRRSFTDDNFGGEKATWAINIASYKCRLYKPTDEVAFEDIGKVEGVVFRASGASADIIVGDKFIEGAAEYLVRRVYPVYKKSALHHYEFLLDRVI